MRKPNINSLTRIKMLSEFHKLVKCRKRKKAMAEGATEQRRKFRITGLVQQNVLAHKRGLQNTTQLKQMQGKRNGGFRQKSKTQNDRMGNR